MAEPKRVLIVDDSATSANMVFAILQSFGDDYTFEIAGSGPEALVKIEQNFYTLVITDYNMPGFTGLDLTHAIRQLTPDTKVVIMTAYGSDRLEQTAKYFSADDYIDKPFTVKEIREVFWRVLGQTD